MLVSFCSIWVFRVCAVCSRVAICPFKTAISAVFSSACACGDVVVVVVAVVVASKPSINGPRDELDLE